MRGTEDQWVAAPKVEGCLLVNLGDMTARWSNDLYQSTWHRVNNRSGRTRHSIPFFCNCDYDAVVECITACTEQGGEGGEGAGGGGEVAKYPPVKAGPYILMKLGLMRDDDGDGAAKAAADF